MMSVGSLRVQVFSGAPLRVADTQFDGQDAQTIVVEVVFEGVPPGRGNRERIASRVLRKGAAASRVVACADHKARTGPGGVSVVVEPGVEDEVAAVAPAGVLIADDQSKRVSFALPAPTLRYTSTLVVYPPAGNVDS